MRKICKKLPDKPKAKVWRELQGFNPLEDGKFNYNATIEKIALVYGLTVEEVEADLGLDEVLPVFLECVEYVNDFVFAKLQAIPKNGKRGQE